MRFIKGNSAIRRMKVCKKSMNVNLELQSIIEKSGLQRSGKKYLQVIEEQIREIFIQECSGYRVAIKGAGEHTNQLVKLLSDNLNIIGIFSDNVEIICDKSINEWLFHMFPSNEMKNQTFDVVIVSSFQHRKEMQRELINMKKECKIVDIYEELEERGIHLHEAFYFNGSGMYGSVLFDKKQYELGTENEKTGELLCNLILSYLTIRDFNNSFKYMDIYIDNKYKKTSNMQSLKQETGVFLENIKKQIISRKQRDIIVVWNDQVGYHELCDCKFLCDEEKGSTFLENAFTPVPFTFPVFWSFFDKKYSIDDKIYFVKNGKVGKDNRFVHMLEEKGYHFKYIGDGQISNALEDSYKIGYPIYDSSCIRCFQML